MLLVLNRLNFTCVVVSLQLPICWLHYCCRPVEENEDFLTDLEKAASSKGVILMCEAGGTMKASPNFASGKASRSLKVHAAPDLCMKDKIRLKFVQWFFLSCRLWLCPQSIACVH